MTDDSRQPVTGYPAPPAAAATHTTNGYPPPGYATANATNTATAYPYVASHPSYFNIAASHQYYDDFNAQQQRRATFVRRVFAMIVGSILIAGTIVFIIWLVLRPQIPQFRIDNLSLSNFNMSSNSMVSGNWDAQLTVRNPNSKINLYYDHAVAAVYYKSDSIAETTVRPFSQGTKNETTLRATFASLSYLDDWNGLNSDRARGTVEFSVRVMANVRFKAGGWWVKRRTLRVFCSHLPVGVSGNSTSGSLTGGSRQCRVGL